VQKIFSANRTGLVFVIAFIAGFLKKYLKFSGTRVNNFLFKKNPVENIVFYYTYIIRKKRIEILSLASVGLVFPFFWHLPFL
jgi:hypothetical protein